MTTRKPPTPPSPGDALKLAVQRLVKAAAQRAASSAVTKLTESTTRLTDTVRSTGSAPKKAVESKAREFRGGTNKESDVTMMAKSTNVIEEIEIGVPPEVAYEQWTAFSGEHGLLADAEPVEEEPGVKLVWHSENGKSTSDGAVTFHEIAPDLTRVTLVVEKEPHGLKARVGKMIGAPARQARHELEDYRRFVLSETLLHLEEQQAEEEEPEAESDNGDAAEEPAEPKPRVRRKAPAASTKSSSTGSARSRTTSSSSAATRRRSGTSGRSTKK